MNNTQLYLSIGLPMVTIIFAWLSNRSDINRVNDKADRTSDKIDRLGEMLGSKIEAQGASIRAEMIAFRREVHQDLMLLHERVVKVEARQGL
jgi:hypothetical protein